METEYLYRLKCRVIDRYCTFSFLLSYIDVEFRTTEGKCYCPFHENHDTPAAKLYQTKVEGTEDYTENVFCFAESKSYLPHHLLKLGIVPFTIDHVFSSIWTKLSSEERLQFDSELAKSLVVDNSSYYLEYKSGKIDLKNLFCLVNNIS